MDPSSEDLLPRIDKLQLPKDPQQPQQPEQEDDGPQFAPNSHYLGHIEVDSAYDTDGDSTYSATFDTSTSITSSVTNYMFENGRRYHGYKGGRYMIPNDEMEMDREDMKHHISMLMLEGRLHLAPIPKLPQRILDVGTGTGIWAIQIADIYPSAEVIATDLSPIQPTWVPPNLKFEIDDAEAEWLYDANSLDLVHLRYMAHAIRKWPILFEQAQRALQPGGWIEIVDWHFIPASYDNSLPKDSQIQAFYDVMADAARKVGLDFGIAHKLRGMIEEAGFANVREEIFDLPMGPWPKDPRLKEIGMFQQIQVTEGLSGIAMGLLTRVLGWTTQEVEVWLVGVRNEMRDRSVHSFWKMHVVYGQKAQGHYSEPSAAEEPELEFPGIRTVSPQQQAPPAETMDEPMLDAPDTALALHTHQAQVTAPPEQPIFTQHSAPYETIPTQATQPNQSLRSSSVIPTSAPDHDMSIQEHIAPTDPNTSEAPMIDVTPAPTDTGSGIDAEESQPHEEPSDLPSLGTPRAQRPPLQRPHSAFY
ncbi:MAG: hypothetical protein M1814_003242 [Vezdaea aestivalis]|nr:MAG: hypothetical protein M1814_003242 [Vezdaea aestivalis]